ncbi:3-hydroxyisobutyryl-CoA hydrolase [Corynebacterium gerontici]|uniref:3-hydroxyisobutyryl-CoA hydrolase n=1 Tax=Corynebacterium gerontici TaxID=2079234 RepID=A0A3G6IZ35_9CORY|nr:3-hydroxyisobutyryl-CoA hydrolase [Corynebacterium gerontici]AZA11051.1 putative enoyl-CoA hydratase echA8 [Corynebacterium gerontici]
MSEAVVNTSVQHRTGHIELNRPKALNSLNQEMVDIVNDALQSWEDDPHIEQVLITSTSEKGFCAGGDVRAIRDLDMEGRHEEGDEYFEHEYRMNLHLANFPKPIISIADGVVMGGGIGISAHGSHRVVTEKAFAAMPEMLIGFIPDVGSTKMFSSMRGTKGYESLALANFLCLTAWRMNPADMLWAGYATHLVPSDQLEAFQQLLISDGVDAAIAAFATQPEDEAPLKKHEAAIAEVFGHDSWEEIAAALEACRYEDFKAMVQSHMELACPTSVVAAVELLRASNAAPGLAEALDFELRMGNSLRRTPNFVEGVRAVLVDKTKDPKFEPSTTAEVDVQALRAVLA